MKAGSRQPGCACGWEARGCHGNLTFRKGLSWGAMPGISTCFDLETWITLFPRDGEKSHGRGEGGLFQSQSLGEELRQGKHRCPFLGQEPASSKVTHRAESGAGKGNFIGALTKASRLAGGFLPVTLNLNGSGSSHHPHTQPVPEMGVRTPHRTEGGR